MSTFAIGDLQGCAHEAGLLLDRIRARAGAQAGIVFVGDLINRGPASLAVLREVKALNQASGGAIDAVLGNHDLHLLAVAAGIRPPSRSDTLDEILAAPDRVELIDWLRHRPMALLRDGHLLLHAGVLPQWDVAQVLALAAEVEAVLRSADWQAGLAGMYGNQPDRWDEALEGGARRRCVINALTRLRLCTADGVMDFKVKDSAAAPPGSDLLPWFDVPGRRTQGTPIVFGHWSALGLMVREDVIALDSGCVWGGHLSAVNLQDHSVLQVECPEHREIETKAAR
jgi:bis(5'-nucleosyl)-tetraphosphatase (symmetrical)